MSGGENADQAEIGATEIPEREEGFAVAGDPDNQPGCLSNLIHAIFCSYIFFFFIFRFKVIKADRNKIHAPKLPPIVSVNGDTITNLIGNGQLYVIATGEIRDGYDAW